jgi:hypothetical protein
VARYNAEFFYPVLVLSLAQVSAVLAAAIHLSRHGMAVRVVEARSESGGTGYGFFFLACFRCFWYRVFRPFFIEGKTWLAFSMSYSVHIRSFPPPALVTGGAGTFLLAMCRWRVIKLRPSFSAA